MAPPLPNRDVLGSGIAVIDHGAAIERIEELVAGRGRAYFCLVSVHGLIEARRDAELRAAYVGAEANLPDGMPVVWALRRLGETIENRVYGPTLMERWFERGGGRRAWLYGGHDEAALADLRAALQASFPETEIAGGWSPPHRELVEDEEAELAERIDADRPDVVWCGIGTPRQEKWMARMRPRLEAPVLIGVGAAFDFLAGRLPQAPAWMQRRGLEWAYRLAREPRRLGPRYLRSNPRFLAAFARQWAREGPGRDRGSATGGDP